MQFNHYTGYRIETYYNMAKDTPLSYIPICRKNLKHSAFQKNFYHGTDKTMTKQGQTDGRDQPDI